MIPPIVVQHTTVVHARFPLHVTGLLRVSDGEPLGVDPGAWDEIGRRLKHVGGLNAARHAVDYWRSVYREMGAKPKYRPSVQLLLESYEERGRIAVPVPLAELYCWYSLARGIPVAGYRPEQISGPLSLCVPGKGHPFTPLGQPNAQAEMTKSGEIAYVDDSKTVCRYWNYRDCDQTKLVQGLRDVLFVFDLVDKNGPRAGEGGIEVMSTFASYLTGNVRLAMTLLDGHNSVIAEL